MSGDLKNVSARIIMGFSLIVIVLVLMSLVLFSINAPLRGATGAAYAYGPGPREFFSDAHGDETPEPSTVTRQSAEPSPQVARAPPPLPPPVGATDAMAGGSSNAAPYQAMP